jgi:SSS family solute:Na+ symporter
VHGYVTPADFVRGRYGSSALAFIVAITGLVATMPYIALQLVGLEAVLRTMGLNAGGFLGHLPLLIAFVILAVYTYQSGLRAPALIAFVKDILIYLVILVAVFYLPAKLGGWEAIFGAAEKKMATPNPTTGQPTGSILLTANNQLQYVTLALGSALALFLYPHSLTGILASRGRNVIKRNMVALPAYSLLLGLLALLGYVAIAAGVKPITNNATGRPDTNTIIPVLFDTQFNAFFAGIAFAAIGIGALVPAAIMSIAAANLWTRNIYKEYLKRDATPEQEARQAKLASLVVKFGAVLFVLAIDPQFSIDLQLIGGIIILQTLPAVALGLYTRWFHRWGLIAGWVAGMAVGFWTTFQIQQKVFNPDGTITIAKAHFGGSAFPLSKLGLDTTWTIYAGFLALVANLVVCVIATWLFRAMKVADGVDATQSDEYFADAGDPRVHDLPEVVH